MMIPQTKKEIEEDAFYFFFLDVKKEARERGAAFISEMAASMWEHMKPEERWKYEEQARNKKQNLCQWSLRTNFGHEGDTAHGLS
jgi:hypothetical protein